MATIDRSTHILELFDYFNNTASASGYESAYDALIDRVLQNSEELAFLRSCLILVNEINANRSARMHPNSIMLSKRIIHRIVIAEKTDDISNSRDEFDQKEVPLIDLMQYLVEKGLFTKDVCENSGNLTPTSQRVTRQISLGIQCMHLSPDARKNATVVHKMVGKPQK